MNKTEKIKAEIDRLKKSLPWGSCASQVSMECNCKNEAYNEVLSYIDHIEEEPVSNDLEEAACEYDNSHIDDNNFAFKAGAQWQKEQMIEKACKWLSNVSIEDMTYKYNDFDTSEDWYKFIKDFKKVMEE